jgi:hypothetical protein
MSEREQILSERRLLKKKYKDLFDVVSEILFERDPIGINFGSNTDEYDPEVGTILPRLDECDSAEDVRRITHQEFVVWFGKENAGPADNYTEIAEQIWLAWAGRTGKLGL